MLQHVALSLESRQSVHGEGRNIFFWTEGQVRREFAGTLKGARIRYCLDSKKSLVLSSKFLDGEQHHPEPPGRASVWTWRYILPLGAMQKLACAH